MKVLIKSEHTRAGMTKGELANLLLRPNTEFDTALPQDWLNTISDFEPSERDARYAWLQSSVVFAYPANNLFGVPVPLTSEAATIIYRYSEQRGDADVADLLKLWKALLNAKVELAFDSE